MISNRQHPYENLNNDLKYISDAALLVDNIRMAGHCYLALSSYVTSLGMCDDRPNDMNIVEGTTFCIHPFHMHKLVNHVQRCCCQPSTFIKHGVLENPRTEWSFENRVIRAISHHQPDDTPPGVSVKKDHQTTWPLTIINHHFTMISL